MGLTRLRVALHRFQARLQSCITFFCQSPSRILSYSSTEIRNAPARIWFPISKTKPRSTNHWRFTSRSCCSRDVSSSAACSVFPPVSANTIALFEVPVPYPTQGAYCTTRQLEVHPRGSSKSPLPHRTIQGYAQQSAGEFTIRSKIRPSCAIEHR